MDKQELRRRMKIMLLVVGILFGAIFLWKGIKSLMIKHYFATHQNPAVTVSTGKAVLTSWSSKMTAVGSSRAIVGVNVTAQLGGMIQKIYFTPGSLVEKDTVLVQQNADPNIAQLHALEANAELAKITYDRDFAQYKIHAVSKQQVDQDLQNWKSLQAQVAQQAAIVAQLTIVAPFSGRLGISQVNPGQYLNPGDTVVTLQQLDPIYVDFYLPQQALAQLKVGQVVSVKTDTFPNKNFNGKITTIQPLVDTNTRNVQVEATVDNKNMFLTPGMYTTVEVDTGAPRKFITLPESAVTFNPYGDIVYIVKDSKEKGDDGKPGHTVEQVFVTVGETRGDQIAILKGLTDGQIVVTSGQLKLRNGSRILINNTVQPANNPNPVVTNDHQG